MPLSPQSSARKRQSGQAEQYEVNTASSQDLGYYRRSEEDSDPDVSAHTPMIMDSEIRSPQRDGLAVPNTGNYKLLFVVTQSIGGVLVLLVAIWLFRYLGGIGFSDPKVTFNFHPLFMVIGFVVLFSNGMLIYRTCRGELKPKLKLMHAILNGSVIGIASLGSLAVFYFHNKANIPHFYSLHSWLGILTWTFFLSQFTVGFVTFLFPGASYNIRTLLMPFHRFGGVATFVLACATCLTGLNEKAIFTFTGNGGSPKYSDLPAAGVLTNLIAIVIVAYASLVVYLVTKPEFKRNPLPEEQTNEPKHYEEVPNPAAP